MYVCVCVKRGEGTVPLLHFYMCDIGMCLYLTSCVPCTGCEQDCVPPFSLHHECSGQVPIHRSRHEGPNGGQYCFTMIVCNSAIETDFLGMSLSLVSLFLSCSSLCAGLRSKQWLLLTIVTSKKCSPGKWSPTSPPMPVSYVWGGPIWCRMLLYSSCSRIHATTRSHCRHVSSWPCIFAVISLQILWQHASIQFLLTKCAVYMSSQCHKYCISKISEQKKTRSSFCRLALICILYSRISRCMRL